MYANVANLRPSIVFSFTLIIYMYVQVISNKVDDKSLKKIIIIIPKKKKIFDTTVSKRAT